MIAHYKAFSDDESLTAINNLKEPIKGYQHYDISDNELDNKVDLQGPVTVQTTQPHPYSLARLYTLPPLQGCALSG